MAVAFRRLRHGRYPAPRSEEAIGFELRSGAGDEHFDDSDGWDREQHPDRPKEDRAPQDPNHYDEWMNADRATEDDRLIDDVFEQFGERHGPDDPQGEILDADHRQQRMDFVGQNRIGQSAHQRHREPHVRNHVTRSRDASDHDRPAERYANDDQ